MVMLSHICITLCTRVPPVLTSIGSFDTTAASSTYPVLTSFVYCFPFWALGEYALSAAFCFFQFLFSCVSGRIAFVRELFFPEKEAG